MEIRISRILDASRRMFPNRLGRAAWLGVSVCGAVLVYVAAVVQLAPAQIPSQSKATIPVIPQPQLVAQAGAPPLPAARQTVSDAAAAGSLSGIVRDPSSARVPSAIVVAQGPDGKRSTASTNTLGEWSLSGLPAGSYSLEVVKTGFVANRRLGLEVAGGAARTVDTNLAIGSTFETVTIAAAGNPRPAAPAAQGALPRVGGEVQPPYLIKKIFPVYPASARDQGVSGPVVISAVIAKDGTVIHSEVMNDAPAVLRDAALRAVQSWEYTPMLLNNEPVETLTTITINFQLNPE